ncbi:MAG TPA: CC/Se motif family (seleno)protein, partial [Syntrophales bacterium]|nr:CC/Se motif family (seleno)protein [Syntrophales bacterium]
SIYLLDAKPVGLCCGRVAFEPQITIGIPTKQEGYVRDVINDIQIYIPRRFAVPYPLTIDVKRQFGRKSLRLNGWRLI